MNDLDRVTRELEALRDLATVAERKEKLPEIETAAFHAISTLKEVKRPYTPSSWPPIEIVPDDERRHLLRLKVLQILNEKKEAVTVENAAPIMANLISDEVE